MALVVMLLALAAPLTAGWWKLQSGAITVYTDGAQSAGREALEKLDLARRVFSSLNGVSLPLPVEVFALTSEARFRALRPSQPVQGFYQSAAERDYIVLNMSAAERGRIVFHEYVHMVLNHTAGPLPAWLEEGLAEFHSTVEVVPGKVRLGKPIGNHLRLLAVRPWMAAGEMAGVTKDSPHFDEASRAGVFYAQSWALVHMLRMDEAYRGGFGEFLAAVGGGQAQAAASQKVYGKALPELIVDLKRYLDRTALPVADYSAELESAAPVETVELPALDSDLAYAGLANQCGRREEAEKIYRKYRKAKPDTARMATALAMIELASKRWEAARRLFEQAIAFPEATAEAYFEYAMLLRDTAAAPRGEIRSLLQQAIGRNPRHAEAQFLLGAGYAAEGRHGEAIGHLEQALAVFPRQSYFWHALAVSYEASGRREDAMR
ncbi:MAG: tetratricopeptide repeat protein, partial [Bryobacterales bacterium]|nr:tetratricopeptide repeat protein [Bryobacterales bacterium]